MENIQNGMHPTDTEDEILSADDQEVSEIQEMLADLLNKHGDREEKEEEFDDSTFQLPDLDELMNQMFGDKDDEDEDEEQGEDMDADDYHNKAVDVSRKGHSKKAELMLLRNEDNEAIDFLTETIRQTKVRDRPDSVLVAAQCCVTLLNLLDESNEYDLIIEICDKGLQHTTQEQPSAAIGFFMYRKALALDAQAYEENFRSADTIQKALSCYQAAYDLNQDRQYSNTIEKRYAVLREVSEGTKVEFTPLIKRPFYVTQQD